MNRYIQTIAVILFFGSATSLFSQEIGANDPKVPASSNASSAIQGATFNVSQFSGAPVASIPLLQISGPNVSLPISLAYSSNGVRVNQLSGWVGLGWNLNAGGAIVREVRDLPDDCKNVDDGSGAFYNAGFLYNSNGNTVNTLHGKSLSQLNTSEKDFMFKDMHDTEPDIFYFNFGRDSSISHAGLSCQAFCPHQPYLASGDRY